MLIIMHNIIFFRKKRVNYILIGMVLAFIGCWLPMTAVNLAKDFSMFVFLINC